VLAMAGGIAKTGESDTWGHYVMLTYPDGSATVYAHLQPDQRVVGPVDSGQQIALSDNSGKQSHGNHLHIEYSPSAMLPPKAQGKGRLDPAVCMTSLDGTYSGSYSGIAHDTDDNGNPIDVPVSGSVGFSIANELITVTVPGPGAGSIADNGTSTFIASGVGAAADAQCTFTGLFSAFGGIATGSGTWSCTFDGGDSSGTWSGTRQ
jgi:Peptidase family M23